MERAMGSWGLQVSRVFLALAHWEFAIGQMTFTLKSLQTTVSSWVGGLVPMWCFGVGIWLLYTPLVWVRRLEPLS